MLTLFPNLIAWTDKFDGYDYEEMIGETNPSFKKTYISFMMYLLLFATTLKQQQMKWGGGTKFFLITTPIAILMIDLASFYKKEKERNQWPRPKGEIT